jgi:hypothetical protein
VLMHTRQEQDRLSTLLSGPGPIGGAPPALR